MFWWGRNKGYKPKREDLPLGRAQREYLGSMLIDILMSTKLIFFIKWPMVFVIAQSDAWSFVLINTLTGIFVLYFYSAYKFTVNDVNDFNLNKKEITYVNSTAILLVVVVAVMIQLSLKSILMSFCCCFLKTML